MHSITKTLALAAAVLAGAFGATAAQASAANFNVDFAVKNGDGSVAAIRTTTPLPGGISGLINPPSSIPAGGFDPATGNGVWSDVLPAVGHSVSVSLAYARASDNGNPCTFGMTITHDTNVKPYLLQFTTTGSPRCTAPAASVRTSDGQFMAQTYVFTWADS